MAIKWLVLQCYSPPQAAGDLVLEILTFATCGGGFNPERL